MNSEKINSLNVSDSWKDKFRNIESAEPISLSPLPNFKYPKKLNFWTKLNTLAFLFNFIYYAIKGMWKKGLVLFGINVLVVIILSIIAPQFTGMAWIVPAVLAQQMANTDFYRFKVLDEGNFWW